jgi:nucleotide-binding universal stress UspA family protein
MHVLVATDGSDDAITAAQRGLAVVGAPDAVSLLCVTEEPLAASAGLESGFAGGITSPQELDEGWKASQDSANHALDLTAAALDPSVLDGTVPIERLIEDGPPGAAICDVAKARDVHVIVVGSRGRGAIKRALLGSVSAHVVHNAPCPVLVVRVH